MKNFRNLITVLFVLMLLLALAIGCAKKQEEKPAMETEQGTMAADTTMMAADTMAAAMDTTAAMEQH